ncbi:MAG: hypothetical protein EOM73_06865 [Bacteroidia bacterium]|nr:hypothetical protein [Bacteroidia bacterium]
MKLIRSNKKGFGIHSPSVFQLVTRVLFPPPDVDGFIKDKFFHENRVEENLKLIFRLLHFYQPARVLYVGEVGEGEPDFLKKAVPSAEFVFQESSKERDELKAFPFVIFAGIIPMPEMYDSEKKLVWCVKIPKKNKKMADFFQSLVSEPYVSVSIRLKEFGIIIVDRNILKHGYVIK